MMMSKKNRWIISPYGITDNFSSSSKFFSTSTVLFGSEPELTIEQKYKKYSSNFKRKYITPLAHKFVSNLKFNPEFYTFDIEAYTGVNGKATPYLFGIYNIESGFHCFYGSNCIEEGINFILQLQPSEGNKLVFYAHNSANYDAYLTIKQILSNKSIQNVENLMDPNNGLFYIKFELNGITYEFKDSYKLIPLPLDKILKGFNINVDNLTGKLPFKHSWVNASNLKYKGRVPKWLEGNQKLLTSLGVISNGIFDFKEYAIAYNKIDTVGLHKVIEHFFRVLIDNFHIDFTHCITLPQLVMDLFRKKFLEDETNIRLFSSRTQNLIGKAYYGAHTSVYKPFGNRLYYYDINSLYPYCMLKDMPVGSPKPFNKDLGLNKLFGFALVKVTCPSNIKIPVLPVYIKIKGNEKLVFPTGVFKGYYFSEELKYAQSLGYKIEILQAWEFKRGENLFEGYINKLYELKRTANKNERNIFKLCLNTLYGRMGQKRNYLSNIITRDLNLMESIEKNYTDIRQTTLLEDVACYSFSKAPNPDLIKKDLNSFKELSGVFEKFIEERISNIAIAAAITSYARIEIDKYKRIPGITCYYSDTDSVILDKPLPKEYLGDELGKMKNELADVYGKYTIEKDNEYYVEKGIFLRDKVYSLWLRDGRAITKFSGLNSYLIKEKSAELFSSLESIYFKNKENLTFKSFQMSKDPKTFEITQQEVNKIFTFEYEKRILIRDKNNIWVDTKPIHITSVAVQKTDFEPVIGRQTRKEKFSRHKGLIIADAQINHYNVFNSDYKGFDGFMFNYFIDPLEKVNYSGYRSISNLLPETSNPFESVKNKLLACLQIMAEKAIEENILVKNIGYLITEEYMSPFGYTKMNTINYLDSFVSIEDLLQKYEQHLVEVIEGGCESGNMLSLDEDSEAYNILNLSLRILVPKNLIKDEKLPAQQLKYVKDTDKLIYFSSQFLALPAPSAITQGSGSLIKEGLASAKLLQLPAPVDSAHLGQHPKDVVRNLPMAKFKALAEKPLGTDQLNLIENKIDPRLAPMTMSAWSMSPNLARDTECVSVDALEQKLVELDKKIQVLENEKRASAPGFVKQLTEARLMNLKHELLEGLNKLRKSGVYDPYSLTCAQSGRIRDPALAPISVPTKPEGMKLLPAPPKLLALSQPKVVTSGEGSKDYGASSELSSVIYLPPPLPKVIYLPGPLFSETKSPAPLPLIIESPEDLDLIEVARECNLQIKALNIKIIKLKSIIEDFNSLIQSRNSQGFELPGFDKNGGSAPSSGKINFPDSSGAREAPTPNAVEIILLPGPAKLLALPAPVELLASPAPSGAGPGAPKAGAAPIGHEAPEIIHLPAPQPPQSKESEKGLKEYYESMGFKYIPRRRRLTQQELWFLDRGLWPEDMKSDDDDD